MLSTLRSVARVARPSLRRVHLQPAAVAQHVRCFSSSNALQKLQQGLANELQFEKENYSKPDSLAKLPKEWTLTDKPGDVNLKIEKDLGSGKKCTIEWQLVSPYDPEMDDLEGQGAEGETPPAPADETDFTITIQSGDGEKGLTYFCNTQQGEGHRFIVGNVKTWSSAEERDSVSGYNGPDFEDLESSLQESMDEYLSEIGITDEIYDFIDSSAIDKELREYMRWLENLKGFMAV